MRTFLRVMNAIGFIVAGVSVLMDLGSGEVGFALFGGVGFAFGLLTFLLLNPNPAKRPVRFRTATIVYHWIVMAFTVLFGGGFLLMVALGAGEIESALVSGFTEALLVLYALFLAFAVWVTWRTIGMLRSDGREETETTRVAGGFPIPRGTGGIAP